MLNNEGSPDELETAQWWLAASTTAFSFLCLSFFVFANSGPNYIVIICVSGFSVLAATSAFVCGNEYLQTQLDRGCSPRFVLKEVRDPAAPAAASVVSADAKRRRPQGLKPAEWRLLAYGGAYFIGASLVASAVGLAPGLVLASAIISVFACFFSGMLYRQRILDLGVLPKWPMLRIRDSSQPDVQ